MTSRRGSGVSLALLLPAMAAIAFATWWPLASLISTLTAGGAQAGGNALAGLLGDGELHALLLRQVGFVAATLALEIPLGVALALSLPAAGWRAALAVVLVALPLLLPGAVAGAVWRLFARSDVGWLGAALAALGIDYDPAGRAFDAWATLVAADVWHWTPLVALLCHGALRAVAPEQRLAARLDGAGRYATFRHLHWPALRGALAVAVGLRVLDGAAAYALPFAFTGGAATPLPPLLAQSMLAGVPSWPPREPLAAAGLAWLIVVLLVCVLLHVGLRRAAGAPVERR
ncbi:MAG: carbohydrate ABC transporter permease [Lautropia sp.]